MPSFRVDEVEPATSPLPTQPLASLFPDALCVAEPDARVVAPTGTHPLLGAVGLAFAQHRPLVLTPDAVWLTIAQGVAQHVRLHAEALRPRLVRHDGKKCLSVEHHGPMPTDATSWHAAVTGFRAQLAAELGEGPARLFECSFSTSRDVDKLASQIVLLDAYAPYFSLWMTAVCGIPQITLTGTAEDWRTIRARIDVIAELDLARWCASLAPIADHFVRAASGDADVAFWRRIYNPFDAYGGEVITGWITRLYPYLQASGAQALPNPMLDLPLGEPRDVTLQRGDWYAGLGVRSNTVPATLSQVSVHVVDQVTHDKRKVTLRAGVVAIAQDAAGLRPIAGWHLAPGAAQTDDVLDRIAAEHATTPVTAAGYVEGPADLVALRRRFAAVTLFGGAWTLVDEPCQYLPSASLYPAFALADGRRVAIATAFKTGASYVAVGRLAEAPAMICVGTSLTQVLDGVLDGGDIDRMQVGVLRDLL